MACGVLIGNIVVYNYYKLRVVKMNINVKKPYGALLFPSILLCPFVLQAAEKADAVALPDVVVTEQADFSDGRPEPISKTNISAPTTKVERKDIEKTNAVTTSDAVKYESGLFTRQRYIGDPNAPIGMRGSNPYQGGRVMVFMDGMPIWNPLQSSFNGSPRWGLIGPGEIKSVDVIGGPFSAEYSGNAMGGVINFNTLMPQKREIYTEATYMMQPNSINKTDTNLQGFKTFGSYGEKFGDFSTYFSYNHLENEGQPMTPTVVTSGLLGSSAKLPSKGALSGGIDELNPKGNGQGGNAGTPMLQIGSDGITHTIDDLYKWKGGYDINPELTTTFTAAYEHFEVSKTGKSFLTNDTGQTIWGSQLGETTKTVNGKLVGQNDGYSANNYKLANSTAFGKSDQLRETLTLGWGLNGRIAGNWFTNTNVSYFDILNDTTLASSYNPNDPAFKTNNVGTKTSWADSGWVNFTSKFNNEEFFGNKDLSFATGYEYQHSTMLQTVNNLSNYSSTTINATKPISTQSGGTLDTHGLFGQLSWRFIKDWDATLGTRLERWNLSDGTYRTTAKMDGSLNPQDRQVSAWSPKFSLGYQPGRWKFRYSVGKAYRFPVADELFGNSNSVNGSQTLADATLKPEDGTHHNILGEYDFDDGYIRLNLFHENIRNAIYNQYIYVPGTTTLSSMISSIGEVETNCIDTTINFDRVMGSDFDVKVNTTILDATIIANPLNPKLVGNQMPLMPNYRTNMLTTYHYGKDWDFSVGTRYQSNMNSQPDNKDLQLTYYGAFTESVYVDLKTTYHFNQRKGHVSVGIDNVNDYQAFYNHPLPMRTFFAQVGYKF